MRPASLIILADDLTGACDAAAPFASDGAETVVLLDLQDPPDAVRVTAFDLDLRERSPSETYARARRASAQCYGSGRSLFAKIDSTLRGAVVEFLAGILDGASLPIAVVAPAFPQQGRFLVDGRLVVSAGLAEANAIDLREQLTRAGHGVLHVSVAEGVSPSAVAQAIVRARDQNVHYVVVDAVSDDHLEAVTQAASNSASPVLLAGSGGLARALADRPAQASTDAGRWGSGPVVVLSGSPEPATRRQINHLAKQPHVRLTRPPSQAFDLDRIEVLVATTGPDDETIAVARDSAQASTLLAQYAARVATRFRPRAVILVGGATARAVCLRLGVQALELRGEAAAGLPWGVLRGGEWNGVPVITKSGGFGASSLLSDAVDWCTKKKEHA